MLDWITLIYFNSEGDNSLQSSIMIVLCTRELYDLYQLLLSPSRPTSLTRSEHDGTRVLNIISPSNNDVQKQAESQQIALVSFFPSSTNPCLLLLISIYSSSTFSFIPYPSFFPHFLHFIPTARPLLYISVYLFYSSFYLLWADISYPFWVLQVTFDEMSEHWSNKLSTLHKHKARDVISIPSQLQQLVG